MKRRVPRRMSRIGQHPGRAPRHAQGGDGRGIVGRAEHRGAGDQHIGPGGDAARRGRGGDAAIDLQRDRLAAGGDWASIMPRRAAILPSWLPRKDCPPKPGLTDITRMRSQRSSTCSTADTGVAGLSTTPACLPRRPDGLQASGADAARLPGGG